MDGTAPIAVDFLQVTLNGKVLFLYKDSHYASNDNLLSLCHSCLSSTFVSPSQTFQSSPRQLTRFLLYNLALISIYISEDPLLSPKSCHKMRITLMI